MPKQKLILKSVCNVKGSAGRPGDTIEADEKLSAQLLAGRAAVPFEAEKATSTKAENAEKR